MASYRDEDLDEVAGRLLVAATELRSVLTRYRSAGAAEAQMAIAEQARICWHDIHVNADALLKQTGIATS